MHGVLSLRLIVAWGLLPRRFQNEAHMQGLALSGCRWSFKRIKIKPWRSQRCPLLQLFHCCDHENRAMDDAFYGETRILIESSCKPSRSINLQMYNFSTSAWVL